MSKKPGGPDVQSISLHLIEVVDRLRGIDEAAVERLALSMGGANRDKTVIIQPIVVQSISVGRYRLVAGLHRLAAAELLGWTEISAIVLADLTVEDARVLEIDENLYRRELTPGEYADFATMKMRLVLRRDDPLSDGRSRLPEISELGDGPGNARFYAETAGIAGVDQETVRLAIRRRRHLDHVWDRLKQTTDAMNNGVLLDRLRKKFKEGAAERVVDSALRDFGGCLEKAMDAAKAIEKAERQPKVSIPAEEALRNLRKAWKSCPANKKQKFVQDNFKEITQLLQTIGAEG